MSQGLCGLLVIADAARKRSHSGWKQPGAKGRHPASSPVATGVTGESKRESLTQLALAAAERNERDTLRTVRHGGF